MFEQNWAQVGDMLGWATRDKCKNIAQSEAGITWRQP